MKREFLMLAQTGTARPDGWWVSEKLDGIRAFWDGGLSRGLPKHIIPWANLDKDKREHTCTGLWSRYGNVIHAPADWLDQLPHIPLDGELWLGRTSRQELTSIVKRLEPSRFDWMRVKYMVFDSPPPDTIFARGRISGPMFKKDMDCEAFVTARWHILDWGAGVATSYWRVYKELKQRYGDVVEQGEGEILDKVLAAGGEGVMYRNPYVPYSCTRTWNLLKHKPFSDMEVEVVGYVDGKGRHEGRMGSLICKCPAGEVCVSGFTDAEREADWPIGTIITIKYRELSDSGIPIEARYWRKF